MNERSKINGRIFEVGDGPYFNVCFAHVPRRGERINLYSRLDQSTGHDPHHLYDVLQVVHQMTDLPEKNAEYGEGVHTIDVYVRKSVDSELKTVPAD